MAPERHNSADPETVRDLHKLYEDPSDSAGFLAGVKRKFGAVTEGVRRRQGLLGVLTLIAGVAVVDNAEARNAELEDMIPGPFSAEVNANNTYEPNFIRRLSDENPSLTWNLPDRDLGDRVLRLTLRPMPGATLEEMPPAVEETAFADHVMSVVITNDGTEFRKNYLDGIIYRKRLGEPDFSPFLEGGECIKDGREGYLYVGVAGIIYEVPIDYAGPVPADPRMTLAPFNRPEIWQSCATEIPVIDSGIVLVDDRRGPMVYFERRADGGYDGPFNLPWGDNAVSPTIYVNGTGIWIAFQNWDGGTPPLKIYRGVIPHPDRDRDGHPNALDDCPDNFNPNVQDGAACADTPEELAALGFDRRVEPGILLAGAADVIPHPSPPPEVENPQQGVFRGIGGVRSTEAGHLIDMRADLPPPPEGFTWGSISIEINVRDGEAIIMGDPPQVFSPADGSQMLEVDAGFQAVLQGTDVEMWVRGWTYVPLPREDGGVGDGGADGGADAGVEAGRDGGVEDAGGGDGSPEDAGHDGSYSDATVDEPKDASVDTGDVTQDQQINGDAVTDINRHEDGNAGVDANNPDTGSDGDIRQEAGEEGIITSPTDPKGCGCSIHSSPESNRTKFGAMAALALGWVLWRRRKNGKIIKDERKSD